MSSKPKTKRNPSPYIVFCIIIRRELKRIYPSSSFGQMGMMLGHLYKILDENIKENIVRCSELGNIDDTTENELLTWFNSNFDSFNLNRFVIQNNNQDNSPSEK